MRADALLFGQVEDLPMWPGNLRVTRIPPRFLSQEEVNQMVAYWTERGDQQMVDLFLVRIAEGCRWPEVAKPHAKRHQHCCRSGDVLENQER